MTVRNFTRAFRYLVGPFVRTDLTASQAAVRVAMGASGTVHVDYVATRLGQVTGLSCSLTVAPAGSAALLQVFKNGVAVPGCTLSIPVGATLGHYVNFTKGLYPFVAGDRLGVAVTTDGSWTAITSDITVSLEVES